MSQGTARWRATIRQAADEYGVPANLIEAVMELESDGENLAPNVSNARGLMQAIPGVWPELHQAIAARYGIAIDPNNPEPGWDALYTQHPEASIFIGARILKFWGEETFGTRAAPNWRSAIIAYFSGQGEIGEDKPDPLGTKPSQYLQRVTENWRRLDTENHTDDPRGPGGGNGLHPQFVRFAANRVFHAVQGAIGRQGPSRDTAVVRNFATGEAIACDGYFDHGQEIDGDDRWLQTSGPAHLAIHTSGVSEAI